jgi:hypothetical protein
VLCPSAGWGYAKHIPVATRKAPALDGKLLEHVSIATNRTEEAMHCIQSRRFLGNAYRNVSVHMATNLQRTVTAEDAITLLLKEVIIRFDQNLPQGEN